MTIFSDINHPKKKREKIPKFYGGFVENSRAKDNRKILFCDRLYSGGVELADGVEIDVFLSEIMPPVFNGENVTHPVYIKDSPEYDGFSAASE